MLVFIASTVLFDATLGVLFYAGASIVVCALVCYNSLAD